MVSNDAEAAMKAYIDKKGFHNPVILCDENTAIYAERILKEFPAKVKVVDGHAHATEIYAAQAEEFIAETGADVMIACGSGSVHDITRYAAGEKKIPFLSYPTAASVDGFVSGVAAMTWYGQKLTFESIPPLASFAAPAVFCTAPDRLTASGVGDVFGKYTSLFDWEIGRILTGEYFCPEISSLETEAMRDLYEALVNRDKISKEEYTTKVMNALLLSGLAIQLTGNSRPASGSEHHMSHLWEMHCINEENDALHGEKVAVGLVAVVKAYKEFLKGGVDFDRIEAIDLEKVMSRDTIAPAFGELTDGIMKENMPGGNPASSSLAKIHVADRGAVQKEIDKVTAELPDAEEIERILRMAGTPCTTADIGLSDDDAFVEKSLLYAPYARNRITLLKILSACRISEAK